nr:reverse transcriptase domain-containing protein [Tanacetum cinerariifolium]
MEHLHPSFDLVIITAMITSYIVIRIYIDGGGSVDILYEHCFNKLPEHIRSRLKPPTTPLIGFSCERSYPEGVVDLALTVISYTLSRTIMLQFHIVKSTSKYNVILRRTAIHNLNMEVSIIRLVVKFPTEAGITIVRSDYPGRDASLVLDVEESNTLEIVWEPIPRDTLKGHKVIINLEYPNQPITVGADLSPQMKNQLA